MSNRSHKLLLVASLTSIVTGGSNENVGERKPLGIDASQLPYLLPAPYTPASNFSISMLRPEQRHLENTTVDTPDDSTAYDDAFFENATVVMDDPMFLDDAFFDNATFSELCPSLETEVDRLFQGLYKCACDQYTISVVCSTPTALPVVDAPNLKVVLNNTVFYDDTPNATIVGDDGVANIVMQEICFDYRYVVPPKPQTGFPPKGCLTAHYSEDGTSIETCSATLTDGNKTLKNCSSCSGCSGGVILDCSNVNELAVSDGCYAFDGTETEGIFSELVKSVGSGSVSIRMSLRLGLVLLLGQAAMLTSLHFY